VICDRKSHETVPERETVSSIDGPIFETLATNVVAKDTEFGLAAGICTICLKHAMHFMRNAEAGVVMVNFPSAGLGFHVPFGGRKESSFVPREQGRYAAEFFTTVKKGCTAA
jgi:alpha-ketoglutaric semialdehyde dehydrogenase